MNFRRISKSLLAFSIAALYTVSTFGATIIDVASTHWAYSAITSLEEKGYMTVNSKGEFLPNHTMTYFEVADVLAKATGYVDVDVDTTVDAALKEAINKKREGLKAYAAKYSAWDKLYDKQVAYLLVRGYIKEAELDSFVATKGDTQAKAIITKEALSMYIVRLMQKENTAKTNFGLATATDFKDDAKVEVVNKPYVAYLKSIGITSPDAQGNFNPDMQVTKALCAKLVASGLEVLARNNSNTTITPGQTSAAVSETILVKKVIDKNSKIQEYYINMERGGNASYCSIKGTTPVYDATGKLINVKEIPEGTSATATFGYEGNLEYITSLKLAVTTNGATGSTTVGGTTVGGTTVGGTTTGTNGGLTYQVVSGTLLEKSATGIIRVSFSDGTVKSYMLDPGCTYAVNGVAATLDQVSVGNLVSLAVNGTNVNRVQATSTNQAAVNGEVISKKLTVSGIALEVKQNGSTQSVVVPSTAWVTRNGRTREITDIRIGDKLQFAMEQGLVVSVTATGEQSKVNGYIKEIHLAQPAQVVINVNDQPITYTVNDNAEIYDNNTREYISIRELHLGQCVELLLESKEVISVDVQNSSSSVNYMGTILKAKPDFLDMLVDYDPISGESQVFKRVFFGSDMKILLNGKSQDAGVFEENMEILITYQYLDDRLPIKIQILD